MSMSTNNAIFQTYSPSSSPPSSPATNQWPDSSPFTSPKVEALQLGSDDDTEADKPARAVRTDPFAGSYVKGRTYPQKHPDTRAPPDRAPVKKARYMPGETNRKSREDDIWEAASTKAYEDGCRVFQLMDQQLTEIPPRFILDLQKMVVLHSLEKLLQDVTVDEKHASNGKARRFRRVQTEPASAAREFRRSFSDRAESFGNSLLRRGEGHDNIQLFLSRNEISRLPRELWHLNNLTVLTLRGNNITYLPPEISNLKSLRNLNVANNQLAFVPSELKYMILHDLQVHPNPFLPKPDPTSPGLKSISETTEFFTCGIPTLVELSLRGLLSKPQVMDRSLFRKDAEVTPIPTRKTVLEQVYELPLPIGVAWRPFSPPLAHILNTCVSGCLPEDSYLPKQRTHDDETMEVNGVGQCPNPHHWDGSRAFLKHVEERFSWETQLAGIKVGGHIPVRWRGCGRGCLTFLEGQREDDYEEEEFELDVVKFDINGLGFDD